MQNGKENGNCHLGFRVSGKTFRTSLHPNVLRLGDTRETLLRMGRAIYSYFGTWSFQRTD